MRTTTEAATNMHAWNCLLAAETAWRSSWQVQSTNVWSGLCLTGLFWPVLGWTGLSVCPSACLSISPSFVAPIVFLTVCRALVYSHVVVTSFLPSSFYVWLLTILLLPTGLSTTQKRILTYQQSWTWQQRTCRRILFPRLVLLLLAQ